MVYDKRYLADTLDHWEMANPRLAPAAFSDPATFLNTIEWTERRKDAHLAVEYVLPLPYGITRDERNGMARQFAWEHFVSKGVPVLITIHRPVEGEVNWHAHLIRATRRVGPDGFHSHKARDLDPQIRTSRGRRFVAEAQLWGEAWSEFQDRWFADRGIALRVDPVAPIAQEHVGPKRWNRTNEARIKRNQERRILNAKTQVKLDPGVPHSRAVKDIARELSKEYNELVVQAHDLLGKQIPEAKRILANHQDRLRVAEAQIARQWEHLGLARKGIHQIGALINGKAGPTGRRRKRPRPTILLDPVMEAREKERAAALRGIERWSNQLSARKGELRIVTALARISLNAIRPRAEAELAKRQELFRGSREFLDAETEQTIAPQQQQRRGRSLTI
jgi:hypothetical protein